MCLERLEPLTGRTVATVPNLFNAVIPVHVQNAPEHDSDWSLLIAAYVWDPLPHDRRYEPHFATGRDLPTLEHGGA